GSNRKEGGLVVLRAQPHNGISKGGKRSHGYDLCSNRTTLTLVRYPLGNLRALQRRSRSTAHSGYLRPRGDGNHDSILQARAQEKTTRSPGGNLDRGNGDRHCQFWFDDVPPERCETRL